MLNCKIVNCKLRRKHGKSPQHCICIVYTKQGNSSIEFIYLNIYFPGTLEIDKLEIVC